MKIPKIGARFLAAYLICITLIVFGACNQVNREKTQGIFSATTPGFETLNTETFGLTRQSTMRARVAKLRTSLLEAVGRGPGSTMMLNLFTDAQFQAVTDQFETLPDNASAWSGHLVDQKGSFTLLQNGTLISAVVRIPGKGYYGVTPRPDGDNLIYQFDPSKEGECANTEKQNIKIDATRMDRREQANDVAPPVSSTTTTITVLVLYTAAVEKMWGGKKGAELVIDQIVKETNKAYTDSLIQQQIVVTKIESPYTESGLLNDDLHWVQTNQDVATTRNLYKSDLVALIVDHVNDPTQAGLGNVMSTNDRSFESRAFSVIVATPARDNYSFAHELGHNMGACHALTDNKCAGAYPYSYGWRFNAGGSDLRTIMAYPPGERIGYFSNPDVKFNNVSTGVPESEKNPANNSKTLNNTAATVSHFR